jgi:hypothetical protein
MTSTKPAPPRAVFTRDGDVWHPSVLSRGPWDPRAQHGGAPSALFAHVAESAMAEAGWQLSRLSVELVKPVPVAPLATRVNAAPPTRATARLTIDLLAGEVLVARAHALMLRSQSLELPAGLPAPSTPRMLPLPADCSEPLRIPGLPLSGVSFYETAMTTRAAQGDVSQGGPAAAWFKLAVPLIDGVATSPAMRAAAAADFGNGLSWVLPAERILFSNADLSLHLYRPPAGEWVGLMAETLVDAGGAGIAQSRLYDEQGPIGIAVQTLVLRARNGA